MSICLAVIYRMLIVAGLVIVVFSFPRHQPTNLENLKFGIMAITAGLIIGFLRDRMEEAKNKDKKPIGFPDW